jgi:lysine 6-dehydrogenase
MKIVVLGGAGAMGQVIVRDLLEFGHEKELTIADFNVKKAEAMVEAFSRKGLALAPVGGGQSTGHKLQAAFADITDKAQLVSVLKGAEIVINSGPYVFNVAVMEAALEAGCHYIDLGGLFHTTRKQLELHERFLQKGLIAVLGMGAAPGMTNIMAAAGAEQLDSVESIDVAVGCIDFVETAHPLLPPYALDTLLDEYTLEPMVFQDGKFESRRPMSGEIQLDLPHPVGKCAAILTLHSEVATLPLSYKNKGVRNVTFRLGLPEELHKALKFLVDLGFGTKEPLPKELGGVNPRKVLGHLITSIETPDVDPNDSEVVRVDIVGKKSGNKKLVRMETTVFAHKEWKVSCGALDTGVPPSIVAHMIARGQIKERGVLPPESCVPIQPFFDELAKRDIFMRQITEEFLSH